MKYQLEECCYVLLRTNAIHPIAYHRHDFLWYPETAMSLVARMNYRPYVQSIVTEDPWLIALYDREKVFVWVEGRGWRNPNQQTFGGDISGIMSHILKLPNQIPAQVLDGGETLDNFVNQTEISYTKEM